jgi:N-terminal acetyltransferase B complex catalytic subunit
MTTTRQMTCDHLLRMNNVNLDQYTETYNQGFYLQYLAQWPEYFVVNDSPDGRMMGYVIGKVEGKNQNWHGHVSAVTVAPEARRLGMARNLMDYLEDVSDENHQAHFVDLYVRISNSVAINMYKKLGYIIYRQIIGYYSGTEDAYDMRKALARDPGKLSEVPLNPLRVKPGVGSPSGDGC